VTVFVQKKRMTKKVVTFRANKAQLVYDPALPPISVSAKVAQLTGRQKSPSPKQRRNKRKQASPQRLREPYPGFFDVVPDPERSEPVALEEDGSEEESAEEQEYEERIHGCSYYEEKECAYLKLYGTGPKPCDCGCNDGARECDCALCHGCMGPCENACSLCSRNCYLGLNIPIGNRLLCDLCTKEENFGSLN